MLGVLSIIRIFYVYRVASTYTKMRGVRAQRVCLLNTCESNPMFSLKVGIQTHPIYVLSINLLFSIMFSAYGIKVFETAMVE